MDSNNFFVDPSIHRKKKLVNEFLSTMNGVPIPSIIEFNIAGSCNRNCSFCPVSDKEFYKKTNKNISIELYSKIMDDLVKIDFTGKILYSAFCEPLLHRKLNSLIEITKKKLPNCRLEMVSNGDLVTKEKLVNMFKFGLDAISISLYDGPKQIEHFELLKAEAELSNSQVILRRRYYENGNYGMTISNRTGLIDSNKYRDEYEKKIDTDHFPLAEKCFYPFYMILIDYTGDMLICPHDWRKTTKAIGNLKENNFWDLWTNDYMMGARMKLGKGDRSIIPCNTCDVRGTLIGKDSYEAWLKVTEK